MTTTARTSHTLRPALRAGFTGYLQRARLTALAAAGALALTACSTSATENAAGHAAPASSTPPATSTQDTQDPSAGWPRTVTVAGADVEVAAPPQRVVAMSTEVGDLALELVGPERMAAISAGSATPGTGNQIAAAEKVETHLPPGTDPDPERILSLEPDLVLMTGRHDAEQQVADVLGGSGVATAVFESSDFTTPDDVRASVETLGALLGAEEEAADISARIADQVAEVTERSEEVAPQRVLVLMARGGTAMLMGAGSTTTELVEMAGGISIAHEEGRNQAVAADPEVIVAAAPDVILVQDFRDQGLAPFAELLDNPALAQVPAIAQDRVHLVDAETTSGTAGSRIGEGLAAIADVLAA